MTRISNDEIREPERGRKWGLRGNGRYYCASLAHLREEDHNRITEIKLHLGNIITVIIPILKDFFNFAKWKTYCV